VVTEAEIDGLGGRALDVLIETKIMARKVKVVEGEPCAWDGKGKAVMKGLEDFILEDYTPERDGKPSVGFDPKRVFEYSNYDLGVQEVTLSWNMADPGWVASVKWYDPDQKAVRQVKGRDEKYARLAVYRGALKAVLT
jgi:hypothetical protein